MERRTNARGLVTLARFVVGASLFATASGCGYFHRVSECRKLAAHVNTALDSIAEVRDAGGETAATYGDIADRYDTLGKEVASFAKGTDPLDKTVHEYSVLFSDAARVTRGLSRALERKNAGEVARIRRELGLLSRREKTLVARIEGSCRSP
jgi:hypothetical protein